MEYFIPAWSSQREDWSLSIPTIDITDATQAMRVLQNNNHEIGLIISSYQPQIMDRLNELSFRPAKFFSLYDYLQGIETLASRTLQIEDFNWPEGAILDYTPFHTLIVVGQKLYARVVYDTNGRILKINYEADDNEDEDKYTLLFDNRGFISQKSTNAEEIYFDSYGNWRFKINKQTKEVSINPSFNRFKQLRYQNISLLLNEILDEYLSKEFNYDKDKVIVTVDNNSHLETSLVKHQRIFLINEQVPYKEKLTTLSKENLVVSTQEIADKIEEDFKEQFKINVIPTNNTIFKLGHSTREKRQEITFFAEYIDPQKSKQLINRLCEFVAQKPKNRSLKILTYNPAQENNIGRVVDEVQKENSDKFTVNKKEEVSENDFLEESDLLPNIILKNQRLTSTPQLLNSLDTSRVLINYGKPDELMQTAAISLGIPQLQNFVSPMVINNKNGYIYSDEEDLMAVLTEYLENLTKWNEALVYNVDLMNKYSEANILKKWHEVLK